jgi:hypothetical protein
MSEPKPKFSAETLTQKLQKLTEWAQDAVCFARELDWLGDAKQYPEGSEKRDLALVRDQVDFRLNDCCRRLESCRCARAETTRVHDLLLDVVINRTGDGPDALRLMRRYHSLFGDETEKNGEVGPDTLPDIFAWDTYQRVSALRQLAAQYPKHIRHSARYMPGWPMIVSHHLDGTHEFETMAELLELGADYPLDAGPRKRRGTETPMFCYLQPLVSGLHVLYIGWDETDKVRIHENFASYVRAFWWSFPKEELTPEIVAILKRVLDLPPLTKKAAREWSRKVIVPFIMIKDAADRETCKIPALRNIWQHKSVKSRATFQSRLHSAVTDTLQRFGRPG